MKLDRDRASEGTTPPPQLPFKTDTKARHRFYAKQLPLQEGRKVAFHPPNTSGAEVDENTWILAVIMRCINQEKHRWGFRDLILETAALTQTTDMMSKTQSLKKMDSLDSAYMLYVYDFNYVDLCSNQTLFSKPKVDDTITWSWSASQ